MAVQSDPLIRAASKAVAQLLTADCDKDTLDGACEFVYSTVCNNSDDADGWQRPAVVDALKGRFHVKQSALEPACDTMLKLKQLLGDTANVGSVQIKSTLRPTPFGKNVELVLEDTAEAVPEPEATAASASAAVAERDTRVLVDTTWLKRKCNESFGISTAPDMALAIFELLSSPHEDMVLQNSLFELLGGERLADLPSNSLTLPQI